jgi:hypothetical protein
MIVVQLNGGLGNQLFQYALGRKLALDRSSDLRFDLRSFHYQGREYKLDHFNIFGCPADSLELGRELWWEKRTKLTRLLEYLNNLRPYYLRHKIFESSIVFDKNILRAPRNVYLAGYWQSEKYFKDIRRTLQKEITLKKPLSPESLQLQNRILACESASLHIRRGDYVSNPCANETHGVLPIEYYYKAINLISNYIQSPEFFIFSEDIPWAKENLRTREKVNFVEHNASEKDCEDLVLMANCKYHIIANSSFSWWGAWLCEYPGKKIIAPQRWYQIKIDACDLLPEEWIRL